MPEVVPLGHPAAEVLSAFSGLTIGRNGQGIECATSDIHFCHVEANEEILLWSHLLQDHLIGIAETSDANCELYLGDSGRCFGRSNVHDAFYFKGASFIEAVERLITGLRSRPMLRPDQDSVDLYGFTYTAESPEVYRYGAGKHM